MVFTNDYQRHDMIPGYNMLLQLMVTMYGIITIVVVITLGQIIK